MSRMRHWHAAIDQADGLANLERVERADTTQSTMRFGNEAIAPVLRPNMLPILAIVSLHARNSVAIFALRRVRSIATFK